MTGNSIIAQLEKRVEELEDATENKREWGKDVNADLAELRGRIEDLTPPLRAYGDAIDEAVTARIEASPIAEELVEKLAAELQPLHKLAVQRMLESRKKYPSNRALMLALSTEVGEAAEAAAAKNVPAFFYELIDVWAVVLRLIEEGDSQLDLDYDAAYDEDDHREHPPARPPIPSTNGETKVGRESRQLVEGARLRRQEAADVVGTPQLKRRPELDKETLGEQLYALRDAKGVKQHHVAAAIGCSASHISKLENNKVANPRKGDLRELAVYFDVPFEELHHDYA